MASATGPFDLGQATHRVVSTMLSLFRVRRALVYRIDAASGSLECVDAAGDRDPHGWRGQRLPIGAGVVGRAFQDGQPVWAADVLADRSIALPDWVVERITTDGFRAVAGVPMIVDGEKLGALSVSDTLGRVFTDEDLRMLTAFADYAAVTLENARLYAESERRRRAAQALAEVGRLLSETLDPEVVGRRVADSVRQLLGAFSSVVYRLEPVSGDLAATAVSGDTGPAMGRNVVFSHGTGVVGRAVAERRPIVTPDLLSDPLVTLTPEMRTRIERAQYRAVLAVPLLVEDRVIGAIGVGDRVGRAFGEEEVALVRAFADQAALALRNAQLYAETREARAVVEASEARFRLLFRSNPLPMWVYDLETLRFLEVNAAALEHYGYSREDFLQMRISDIRPPEDVPRLLGTVAELTARPDTVLHHSGQWRHRLRDGRVIDVEIISHPLDFAGRRASLVVAQDVTERRSLEAQLRQSQRMDAIGQLAGGIAHDFNNLLTVITGRSRLLLERLPAADPACHDLDLIDKTADRAARLTRQLLAFSRKQILQPRVLDLNEVMNGMTPMLQRIIGEDIELAVVARPDLGRVSADPGQLEQVIMNLVVNARDAMPQGGRLTLETANVELDSAYVRRHVGGRPGPHVMLAVSDTGVGMDGATQSRIFEPFFTTKEPGRGTGLGLATVYGIVKQSGGNVWVYSEPGHGTTFKIYLPRVEGTARGAEPHLAQAEPARGVETILLTEDEDGVRELAGEILEGFGYTVLTARDSNEALRIADQHPGPIHLLVTDVVMPKMDGRQLAKILAASRPRLRVLYISGYAGDAIVHHGVLDPNTHFIPKPFTPDALGRKVRAVLDDSSDG